MGLVKWFSVQGENVVEVYEQVSVECFYNLFTKFCSFYAAIDYKGRYEAVFQILL